jgi:hypothetical protein
MSAGTLTLTNNSDLVSGAGTSFSTELTAGDFVVVIVGGVTYTLPVKSVEGDTEITLISKYPGPTQQGSAWNAVPRATQNQVTAALVVQSTEALRGLNYDKQNWQAVFSADGNITVFLPDGTSFSGPSWKSIAETLSTLDVDYLNQLAAQINQDAQQVEADKNTVVDTAQQVSTDAQTASTAATGAQGSADDAAQSETNAEGYKELARKYALNPEDSPVTSNEYSSFHYSEKSRKSAEEAASHNPVEALVKSLNLSDLADRAAAWLNVRPIGATPLAGDPVGPYDATTQRWVENYVSGGGGTGPTMNGVQNFGVGENIFWQSRAFIPPWAVAQDGQLLNRADWPELWAHAQMHGPIDDAAWLGDPNSRGFYSMGDGSTTFRVPDKNGIIKNGVGGAVGDSYAQMYPSSGSGSAEQLMRPNGLPNIEGQFFIRQGNISDSGGVYNPAGAFSYGPNGASVGTVDVINTTAKVERMVRFRASDNNPIYGRYEGVRPNTFFGVWLVRASGGFTAANTSWSVINEDDTIPAVGVRVAGGAVRSVYKVDGSEHSVSALTTRCTIGNDTETVLSQLGQGGLKEWKLPATSGQLALAGANSDITKMTGLEPLLGTAAGTPQSGIIFKKATNTTGTSFVSRGISVPYGTASWTMNATFGAYMNGSGAAASCGPFIATFDSGSFGSYWYFLQGGSVISTANGNITPVACDERVKNIVREIGEDEAVAFIDGLRPIRYAYKWTPDQIRVGYSAQNVEALDAELVQTSPLFVDGEEVPDGKIIDPGEIGAAYLVPVVQKLLREVTRLKAEVKELKGE